MFPLKNKTDCVELEILGKGNNNCFREICGYINMSCMLFMGNSIQNYQCVSFFNGLQACISYTNLHLLMILVTNINNKALILLHDVLLFALSQHSEKGAVQPCAFLQICEGHTED